MNEQKFQRNARAAEAARRNADHDEAEFWAGCLRGLRRHYHGENFGTDDEHVMWMAAAESDDPKRRRRGEGYIAGHEGKTTQEAAELLNPTRTYTIRQIPEDQYRRLRVMAAEREISINTLLLEIIAKHTE